MKNKKLRNLIIIVLIIALIIVGIIIKNTYANASESKSKSKSNILIDDKIVNEIQNTTENEIEKNSIIQEIVFENNEQEQIKQNNTKKDVILIEDEPKEINENIQEKKIDSSKNTELVNTTQTTIQENIVKEEKPIQEKEEEKEQTKQETKIESIENETTIQKCTDSKHGVGIGNSNKWFNSYNEAVSYYDNLINDYSNKIHAGEITLEEYNKKCPYGYETWSCPYCGKWTLNYYFR